MTTSELADYIERYHNHDPKLIFAAAKLRRLEEELRKHDEAIVSGIIEAEHAEFSEHQHGYLSALRHIKSYFRSIHAELNQEAQTSD